MEVNMINPIKFIFTIRIANERSHEYFIDYGIMKYLDENNIVKKKC